MSKAGARLMEAAREMREIARGQAVPADLYAPRDVDVKALRKRLGLSLDAFASTFSFPAEQIREWESGRSHPRDSQRAYLLLIEAHPDFVRKTLGELLARQESSRGD
jgi:putative transcriptional regulator